MAVVATGFFDGVHIGHRMVIDTLLDAASLRGEESVAVTFWPHPRIVLGQDPGKVRFLTTPDEKLSMLKNLGVDRVEVLSFTPEFSRLSTEEYISSVLIGRFGAVAMVLGYDNRMGHDSGSPVGIAGLARSAGLEVVVADKVCSSGIEVSSTRIREMISRGDVALASGLLGYHYSLTVTMSPDGSCIMLGEQALKALPAAGAYNVLACAEGKEFRAVAEISRDSVIMLSSEEPSLLGTEVTISFLGRV